MNALIVYESMFGSTRRIAEAMAAALEANGVRTTIAPAATTPMDVSGYPLVVVGAPTHAHSLPRQQSREQAVEWAADPAKNLTLEPTATSSGVREWLDRVTLGRGSRFAAFSTRVDISRIFAGDAAVAISKRLRRRSADAVGHADFLVDKDGHLIAGEEDRARQWITELISPSAVTRSEE